MKYDFNKAREEYPKLSKEELIEKLIVAEATNVAHCVTICEIQEAEKEAIAKIEEWIGKDDKPTDRIIGYEECLELLKGETE